MRALPLLLVAAGAPCWSAEPVAPQTVSLYKATGSVQCDDSGGAPLNDVKRQLKEAGVRVLALSCGNDGRMYADVCGAPSGDVFIIEVPVADIAKARSLAFAPLSGLPDATKAACK